MGPIPWLYVSEVTPIEYRAKINAIAQTTNYGMNTLIALTSTSMLGALGIYGFVPFAGICLVGTLLVWRYIPETKMKSTDQILEEIRQKYL